MDEKIGKDGRKGSGSDGILQGSQDGTWDGSSDVQKRKIFPRALLDLDGVSGKDKAKVGVNMLKSKMMENLPED